MSPVFEQPLRSRRFGRGEPGLPAAAALVVGLQFVRGVRRLYASGCRSPGKKSGCFGCPALVAAKAFGVLPASLIHPKAVRFWFRCLPWIPEAHATSAQPGSRLRCAPRAEVGCRIDGAECGGGRSVPSASLVRNGGTAERCGSCRQVPAVGAADGEAALLESLEGDTETSVVDAQALAQDGPGERLAGAA